MGNDDKRVLKRETGAFYIRKLIKSGKTRYLSLGTILPPEWEGCTVVIKQLSDDVCVLKLERIK